MTGKESDNKFLIKGKKVKLTNIDGLGNFAEDLQGVVKSQSDQNNCCIKLDKDLHWKNMIITQLNVSARHIGHDLNKIIPRGFRKAFNLLPIIAVNVFDDDDKIGFMAEIVLIK
ncbi:MAG: hypothetical protein HQL27_09960 [Candidatus Omnitrophica bacterium]|nr:hypothetical protein [Candidatus Omnitrophota bacterium]